MMTERKHIRIGYFEDFKGEDSILISADIHGLIELEDVFLKLSNGLEYYDFSKLKLLDKIHRIDMNVFTEKNNIGLKKTEKDKYEWRLCKEKWGEFREKITAMYRLRNEGHHYLDSDSEANDDYQVVLSLNEYPEDFWEKYSLR